MMSCCVLFASLTCHTPRAQRQCLSLAVRSLVRLAAAPLGFENQAASSVLMVEICIG